MSDRNESVAIDYDSIKETVSTKATLFVIEEGDEGSNFCPPLEVWIPNSIIHEIVRDNNQVWVPLWFAEKEGLV